MEEINYNGIVYAHILRNNYKSDGIQFFTPSNYSQQLGYMNRKEGYKIVPHYHNLNPRTVHYTQEVLFIKTGKVQVSFYNTDGIIQGSTVLTQGDIILLSFGAHGFEMLEDSEIIEVKQGPYCGDDDKTRLEL